MKVAIIKYNAGNVQSVIYALKRLGVNPSLTDDKEFIQKADKVIFPGQGEASSAMRYLRDKGLDQLIPDLKQPVLGICIGLQLLCKFSEEGNTDCLGVFDTEVKHFPEGLKVPHMGWNNIENNAEPLFHNIPANPYFYYVHSYYATVGPDTVAKTHYMVPFSAVMQKDNFYAIQAHPEKSGKDGEKLLANFLAI